MVEELKEQPFDIYWFCQGCLAHEKKLLNGFDEYCIPCPSQQGCVIRGYDDLYGEEVYDEYRGFLDMDETHGFNRGGI